MYIVFGVSGSGKTTIGRLIANQLGCDFFDADDFHPQVNIDKMAAGIPLNDKDRKDWLERLAELLGQIEKGQSVVLACSALKEKYRQALIKHSQIAIQWIFLEGNYSTILNRLSQRTRHFFKPELLHSQFNDLEVPEYAIRINVSKSKNKIMEDVMNQIGLEKNKVGLIGLGVMGKNLALNLATKSTSLSVYNRELKGLEENIAKDFCNENKELSINGFDNLESFVYSLSLPRKIFILVKADVLDQVIDQLIPLLQENDIVVDLGNSQYQLTRTREQKLNDIGLRFLGCGISGGEEGALNGPSIMAGGKKEAYNAVSEYLKKIASKDKSNYPCCAYLGSGGAGHFVKMVHNGIEYAEMQLIAEMYQVLRKLYNLDPIGISKIFAQWNQSELNSYLLGITEKILKVKEGKDLLLDKILDKAKQKGTGGWTVQAALELGVPISSISEAVMARSTSSMKNMRVKLESIYRFNSQKSDSEFEEDELAKAYKAARILNHIIGFEMLRQANSQFRWEIDLSEVARIWTKGCIIRSNLMEEFVSTFKNLNSENHLLQLDQVSENIRTSISSLLKFTGHGISYGISLPVFSATANYFNAMVESQSPANLIQAQRDFFGAHTYSRVDRPEEEIYHTNWTI